MVSESAMYRKEAVHLARLSEEAQRVTDQQKFRGVAQIHALLAIAAAIEETQK